MTTLDIVICTHNRAASLAAVLARLEALNPPAALRWAVLVVDNASTDETAKVAEAARARGGLALSYVHESILGVGPARLRGVRESTADWIAFVDDDNLPEPGWLLAIANAIAAHPDAGGFGGRVLLRWEVEPRACFRHFGYCFAEQDLGDEPREIISMVGAGMVLNRAALLATGWADQGPLVADRIGKSMVSGGDAEMTLRIGGAGHAMFYVPDAVLHHLQSPGRAKFGYLTRMAWALGACEPALGLMTWQGGYEAWKRSAADLVRRRNRQAVRGFLWSLRRRTELDSAVVWLAAAFGYAAGFAKVKALSDAERAALMSIPYTPRPQ